MKYLLLVCNDGLAASEAEERLVGEAIGQHIAAIADVDLYGHPLQPPARAVTVRVRGGETLVSDGPFLETKEHIAGLQLVDCDSLERAIEVAASHPLAWFHKVEVRPLDEEDEREEDWGPEVRARLADGPPAGTERYLLLVCSDRSDGSDRSEGSDTSTAGGCASADARNATLESAVPRWIEQTTARGARVAGAPLAGPAAARTVRVRGPHTLVSDGPFVEAEQFVAGFDVIDCADRDEAVAIAAAHPMSWFHAIEVRPFAPGMCGEPSESSQPVVSAGASTG